MLIAGLLLVLEVCNVKPTYRKSWARDLQPQSLLLLLLQVCYVLGFTAGSQKSEWHNYVHPLGGGHIIFAFPAVHRPPSHLVSRHFRQQFLSYLYQIWHAGLLG